MQNKPILILTLALASSGCTLNEGDPQVTLCQLLTAHISHSENIEWDKAKKSQQKDKSMKVLVRASQYSPVQINGECIYLSDADDAGKDYDVNILDTYQNIPNSIVIKGKPIPTSELHLAIQKVTGQSVKDTLKKVQ